jgi:translocation and assembly module TamB
LPLPAAFPGTVLADLHADWVEGAGTGAVHLEGETRYPADARGVAVAGDIAWRFTGEGGRLETFRIESEPVRVWLDRPVELGWREPRRLPPAVLGLDLRLEELTGGRLRGGVAGTLTAEETGAGQPRVRFALLGSDLGTPGRPPGAAEVAGVLDRTDLQVTRLLARLPGGGEFRAQGDVDLAGAAIRRGSWTFEGLLPFVVGPTNGGMPGWVASGEVRGSYTNLVHAAAVRTVSPLKLPGWQPLDLKANWSGRGGDVDDLEVVCGPTGSAAYLRLRASGRFRSEPAEASVRLRFLEVGDGPSVMLALKEPAAVVLRRAEGVRGGRAAMQLRVEPLRLAGAAGEWGIGGEVEWPTRGRFEGATRDGVTGWMAGWREGPPASWAAVRVGSLDVRGHWDGGPLAGEFAFDLEGPVAEVGPVRATGRGGFGAAGVELGEVRFGHLGQGVVTFSGFVPVVAVPGGEGEKWRLLREAAPRGELRAAADAWVWDWLAARTGVRGSGPDLQVSLGGTAGAPEARLELTVGRVPLPGPPSRADADPEWPTVEAVSLHARATLDELVLDDVDVRVAGQHARLTGRLPWPDRPETGGFPDWSKWDWRRAEARLSVAHAELAPFLRLIPGAVQPSGILGAEVTWAGGALGGWVEATGLASQPVERVGTVRDIAVRLAFLGDRVAVERGEARLGGQPVALSGWLALPGSAGSGPVGELWLRATNVAIVRTPGALLRADLDLGLVRTNPGVPPRIGGEVNLRDSVVMLDVRDLVGVDLERPERRPPYFGVDRAPLADWVLDLRVRGAQFARVLSPAFRGTVSADARLVGTLRSPRLLGEGLVDRGQIVFPFGQLQVGQARVRFTELRPFQPVLEGRAEGVNFGYTVSLEIQGTLDQPQVRFDSVPPLGTREVLQMLTAGNLPSREYTYSDATKAQQVGAFLAGDLVSSLTGDPSEEPRLSLRSGQRVSTSGRLTYGVEYRLGPRWSLVGEYDRWSQFGAGVRWRVLEK